MPKHPPCIPKAAPQSLLEAYGRVADLADAVGALRVAADSQTHPLNLPKDAIAKIIEAHEVLKAAHRLIEAHGWSTPG